MKVLLLSDANSVHTLRWTKSLNDAQIELTIFSLNRSKITHLYPENVSILSPYPLCYANGMICRLKSTLNYIRSVLALKRILNKGKFDLVHAHYASSYGALAYFSGVKVPRIVSFWGSDAYIFPKKSPIHTYFLKIILKSSDTILATSKALANEASLYTTKSIGISPFGIDAQLFKPMHTARDSEVFIVGTVKAMEHVYGIDMLIQAFYEFQKQEVNVELHLYGDGSKTADYQSICEKLKISHKVKFKGKVANNLVPEALSSFDVFVAFSRSESFGVAVLEASACEIPVIVSNAEGLPEVVVHNKTGIIIENHNIEKLVEALNMLLENRARRHEMGVKGREFVLANYTLEKTTQTMVGYYFKSLNSFKTLNFK